MKKQAYMAPMVEVIELSEPTVLMAASPNSAGAGGASDSTGDGQAAPRPDFPKFQSVFGDMSEEEVEF